MDNSKVSFRIGYSQWSSEECLEELYCVFKKYSGIIDEVAFFSADTHPPVPLEVFGKRMEKIKGIMLCFRELGMRSGINILATIGHHEENLQGSLHEPWQKMVGLDGRECRGCYCYSDKRMQEYIRQLYKLTAAAGPDFIWIDDDVRFEHMPIGYGCFCEKCLTEFSVETGEAWTRDRLLSVLNEGTIAKKLEVRKKWLEHNRVVINNILSLAETAAHNVENKLTLGFMTGDRFYEGYDFDRWAQTLKGQEETPVIWRPGGGFYTDKVPSEMIDKAHSIGRQVSMLPDWVIDVQSEIENFPYQRLRKSLSMTVLEAGVYLGAGATGTAFNILSMGRDPLNEYLPFFDKIKETKPFYDLTVSTFKRNICEGLWFAWNKDIFALHGLVADSWFEGRDKFSYIYGDPGEIFEIGIPCAYTRAGAKVAALAGNAPLMFDTEEIKDILSGGVIIDVPALECLHKMGLGKYTGFRPAGTREDDSLEILTSHPLNTDFSGRTRDCRQSFKWWSETAGMIEPVYAGAQVLAHIIDYAGMYHGVSMGVFENNLGGRVAVCGYFPWKMMHNLSKSSQLKTLLRWLSKDTVPAYVKSFEKVNIWCRETTDGGYGVFLLNSSFDVIDELEICLLTNRGEVSIFDMDCREEKMSRHGAVNNGYGTFRVTNLKPWTAVLIKSRCGKINHREKGDLKETVAY